MMAMRAHGDHKHGVEETDVDMRCCSLTLTQIAKPRNLEQVKERIPTDLDLPQRPAPVDPALFRPLPYNQSALNCSMTLL